MDSSGLNFGVVIESITQTLSAWGLRVLAALLLLAAGWLAARMIRSSVRKALVRSTIDNALVPFFSSMVYYLALTFVVVAVLSLLGIQTTSFIAVLGAAGLAVGLALRGSLSNFASGVMLLAFRPFGIGDYIEAGGTAGSVVEIGIFSTTMNTPDNVKIVVPNSSVFGQTIKNYSANPNRRNDLVMGVSYDDDLGKAIDTIRRTLADDSRVLDDPEPVIAVSELGDSSVNIVVRPWCTKDDYWSLRFDLTRRLKENLEAAGCSIPFPQRDVHLLREETGTAA